MDKKVCPNCSSENELSRYFCTNCGAFLEVEKYEEKNYLQHQLKFMRIVDNLRHMRLSENVPDELYAHYAEKMERYEAISNLPEIHIENELAEKIKAFLNLCRHPEFQIAFVGTIKTGKSTLINALLGDNYASMDVTPETAALTKFHFSPRDYVEVEFYSKEEWKKLWSSINNNNADKFMEEYNKLNAETYKSKWIGHDVERIELTKEEVKDELTKWSSSKSPVHYFVKEIKVGISTLPAGFPPQVLFVDTPGLFDPVAYRSQITRNYIKRANAVFVCVDAQKINQPEIDLIASVFTDCSNDKDKVHIIVTQWDRLNNPDDWPKQKENYITQLTGKAFFPTKEVANENIIPTAAHIHNLCRDFKEIEQKDDKKELIPLKRFAIYYDYDINDDNDRLKMIEKANISTVYDIIKEKLAENYKRYLTEDIQHRYIAIQHDLTRIAEDTKSEPNNLLTASNSSIEDFKKKAEQKKKDFDEIAHVSAQLNKILDQVESSTARQMEAICGDLRLKLNPGYNKLDEKRSKSNLRNVISGILGGNKRRRK